MPIILLAVLVIAIDQCSKYYIQTHMAQGMSIPIIQNIFHITYILNPGAAFGLLKHQTFFLIGIAIVLVAAIIYFYRQIPANRLLHCSLGLLMGGAVGNLIDRVELGYVVDFFDFRIWPVFNVADIAIVSGVAGIMLVIWNGKKEDDQVDKKN